MMMNFKLYLPLAISCLLMSCAHQPDRAPTEAQEALQQSPQDRAKPERAALPEDVRNSLSANTDSSNQSAQDVLAEPRFAVQANNVDARAFFASLAEDSPYSVVVHPDVSGNISLSLKDVTVAETLAVVQDIYGFDVRRSGRIIRIYPSGLRSETIALDYLSLRRMGLSQTSVSSGGVKDEDRNNSNNRGMNSNSNLAGNSALLGGEGGSGRLNQQNQMQGNGSSITTESETDMWSELQDIIEGIVGTGDGRRVVVAPQAGLVTVTAFPDEIRAAREFLTAAEGRLQRQVILEARIIEVTLNDQYQQGINWQDVLGSVGSTSIRYGLTGGLSNAADSMGGVFGVTISDANFNGVIQLLQTQGNVQVLSNPRVTASNNQKAVIKIGEDEYYVTDVSTTTVTGTATTSTPNIELTPFFSGISLDVTPQISAAGDVTLHVHPSVVETSEQEKTITLNREEFVLPLAQSNIRESDTIVRARNGEVVVLGGLMQTTYTEREAKAPVLGDIPLLGNLFKSSQRIEQKKELIILLRPVVVGVDTWRDELERSSDILKRWYPEN